MGEDSRRVNTRCGRCDKDGSEHLGDILVQNFEDAPALGLFFFFFCKFADFPGVERGNGDFCRVEQGEDGKKEEEL